MPLLKRNDELLYDDVESVDVELYSLDVSAETEVADAVPFELVELDP